MLDHPINSQFIFLISLLFFFLFFCKGFDKWSWAVELYTCIEMPSLLCCAYYNLYRWWSKRQQHTTIRPHRIQITRRRQLPCTRNESNTIFAAVATCSCQIEKSPSPLRNNKQMNPPIWMKSVNSLSLSQERKKEQRETRLFHGRARKNTYKFSSSSSSFFGDEWQWLCMHCIYPRGRLKKSHVMWMRTNGTVRLSNSWWCVVVASFNFGWVLWPPSEAQGIQCNPQLLPPNFRTFHFNLI